MKLKKCQVTNFGSYRTLEFDFSDLGLTLIHGATGSGKSTLQDIPAWILFGITAKDGNADEIKSWQSEGEPTTGTLEVSTPSGDIMVTRIRGGNKSDLYWIDGSEGVAYNRGKDLVDTQKLLSARLGMDSDSYLTAAYFHEFSPHSNFFTAKAKDRRELFERLADLTLPTNILLRATTARKISKHELDSHQSRHQKQSGKLEQLTQLTKRLEVDARTYTKDVERRAKLFEEQKNQKIDTLLAEIEEIEAKIVPTLSFRGGLRDVHEELSQLSDERCPTCKSPRCSEKKAELLELAAHYKAKIHAQDALRLSANHKRTALEELVTSENPHKISDINPFSVQLQDMAMERTALTREIAENAAEIAQLEARVSSLEQLIDLSSDLRAALLAKSVSEIEEKVNYYLEKYFDAELRVTFALDGDKLDIGITKNGYACVYTQLSKGQRQLLKLSFAVSVMEAAANKCGVHLDCLMFDEALDGLDAELKLKAFSLFQELEQRHATLLVIDHSSELRSQFSRSYRVLLTSDASSLELD